MPLFISNHERNPVGRQNSNISKFLSKQLYTITNQEIVVFFVLL